MIPIPSGSNSLVSILFGSWGIVSFDEIFNEDDSLISMDDFISKISDTAERDAIVSKIRSWEKKIGISQEHDARLIHYSRNHPEILQKTVTEVANALRLDVIDTILYLTKADCGDTRWGNWSCEEDLEQLFQHPNSMPSSDGYWTPRNMRTATMSGIPSPRIFGSFAYFLEHYCQLKQILPLEMAVKKMTSLPAKVFGLRDRGVIEKGKCADLVIFDPKEIHNLTTFSNPCVFPTGIHFVLVNGGLAIDQSELTNQRHGKILRHNR